MMGLLTWTIVIKLLWKESFNILMKRFTWLSYLYSKYETTASSVLAKNFIIIGISEQIGSR